MFQWAAQMAQIANGMKRQKEKISAKAYNKSMNIAIVCEHTLKNTNQQIVAASHNMFFKR